MKLGSGGICSPKMMWRGSLAAVQGVLRAYVHWVP